MLKTEMELLEVSYTLSLWSRLEMYTQKGEYMIDNNLRVPLITHFRISTQVFFSDTRHQKRSLTELNEYFDNDVAGKKTMLKTKIELLEVPLIENAIRPLALGRKNYLFAGSNPGAQRAAMMYSFFATCKLNSVEPYQWLKQTLEEIPDTKVNNLDKLLPQNYQSC